MTWRIVYVDPIYLEQPYGGLDITLSEMEGGKTKKRQHGRRNEILTDEDFIFVCNSIKMSQKQKESFYAYYWQHKTYKQIAAETSVCYVAIRDRIKRVKLKLYQHLTGGINVST